MPFQVHKGPTYSVETLYLEMMYSQTFQSYLHLQKMPLPKLKKELQSF